jgi:hypothetical protein
VENPYTGKIISRVPKGDDVDAYTALEAARLISYRFYIRIDELIKFGIREAGVTTEQKLQHYFLFAEFVFSFIVGFWRFFTFSTTEELSL